MPLNYLALEPQIEQYAQSAVELSHELQGKLDLALDLLRQCGKKHEEKKALISAAVQGHPAPPRCALLHEEPADQSEAANSSRATPYTVLASDGSQITPGGHDAVSIALINTSRLCFHPGSGLAPEIELDTRFLFDEQGRMDFSQISADLVALRRDVAELEILARWTAPGSRPLVALGDGPLELFHQPRQGENFEKYFSDYLSILKTLYLKEIALAGYTDRPRAALVTKMLEFSTPLGQKVDLARLEDHALFAHLLAPGNRSAIFALYSTASARYEGELALHFFYLNVGEAAKPWIARVEIPAWVAASRPKTDLIHRALLEQCRLMGARPYPYILHRAHEEALVRFEEKDRLITRLAMELQKRGLGASLPSAKQSAKDLGPRRRMGT